MSDQTNDLIWSMDIVRKLFQTYRIWPSFVGPKLVVYHEERNTLPVKLWKEQQRYINESDTNNSLITIENNILLKNHTQSDLLEQNPSNKRTLVNVGIDNSINHKMIKAKKQKITEDYDSTNQTQSIPYSYWTGIQNIMSNNPIAKLLWQNNNDEIIVENIIDKKQNIVENNNNNNNNNSIDDIDNGNIIGTKNSGTSSNNHNISVGNSVSDENRFQVFKCLMDRGYFIGNADVYGGDYGLYKDGDPTNAHATATVRIIEGYKISVKEFLAFSRVQNQVAKSAVLGFKIPSTSNVVNNFNNNSNNNNNTEEPITDNSKSSNAIATPEICFITFNFRNVSDRIS